MIGSLNEPRIGRSDHGALGIDELGIKARVGRILNRRPAVGLAVGVVRNGRLEFFSGHGLADIASNTPVTQDTDCPSPFPQATAHPTDRGSPTTTCSTRWLVGG
jgi:CubicO group peptidase (beta-lactamase class C family)